VKIYSFLHTAVTLPFFVGEEIVRVNILYIYSIPWMEDQPTAGPSYYNMVYVDKTSTGIRNR